MSNGKITSIPAARPIILQEYLQDLFFRSTTYRSAKLSFCNEVRLRSNLPKRAAGAISCERYRVNMFPVSTCLVEAHSHILPRAPVQHSRSFVSPTNVSSCRHRAFESIISILKIICCSTCSAHRSEPLISLLRHRLPIFRSSHLWSCGASLIHLSHGIEMQARRDPMRALWQCREQARPNGKH